MRSVLTVAMSVIAMGVALVNVGCGDPTGPEREISGEQLYNQYCARCHGPDGRGVPSQPAARDRLSDPRIMGMMSDEHIRGVILAGKPPNMPAFQGEFTDAALMVLVAYVRSLSGTTGAHAPPADETKTQ